jgi:hypothetical protein
MDATGVVGLVRDYRQRAIGTLPELIGVIVAASTITGVFFKLPSVGCCSTRPIGSAPES